MNRDRHLSDEEIGGASERELPLSSVAARHVESCTLCSARLADAIAVARTVSRVAGERNEPEHDLAELAVASIRRREGAVASLNGTVGAFAGVARAVMYFAFGRRT